jgi:hypothetical protein
LVLGGIYSSRFTRGKRGELASVVHQRFCLMHVSPLDARDDDRVVSTFVAARVRQLNA